MLDTARLLPRLACAGFQSRALLPQHRHREATPSAKLYIDSKSTNPEVQNKCDPA